MIEDDILKFVELLGRINAMCLKSQALSDEQKKMYFEILKDLPLEEIERNVILYFREKGNTFFPSIADLRGPASNRELQAHYAWERINWYLDRFYAPEIGNCMMQFIERRMKEKGEGHLFRLLQIWGPEIITGGAIAATRKHFIDAYKANQQIEDIKQLDSGASIKELVNGCMLQIEEKVHG